MEEYAKNFVRASLIYLLLAAVVGLGMAIEDSWIINYTQLHVHLMLLGFMAMLIFGVGYHIIPRFHGHAHIPRGAAQTHLIVANVGLIAMALAWFIGEGSPEGLWKTVLVIGGGLNFLGFAIFALIMFRGLIPVKQH